MFVVYALIELPSYVSLLLYRVAPKTHYLLFGVTAMFYLLSRIAVAAGNIICWLEYLRDLPSPTAPWPLATLVASFSMNILLVTVGVISFKAQWAMFQKKRRQTPHDK